MSVNNDSVMRSVYYKYIHPKEVFIAEGTLVPDLIRKKVKHAFVYIATSYSFSLCRSCRSVHFMTESRVVEWQQETRWQIRPCEVGRSQVHQAGVRVPLRRLAERAAPRYPHFVLRFDLVPNEPASDGHLGG